MNQKTIQRNVGHPEVHRLYKCTSEEELTSTIEDYKKHYRESITILDKGKFSLLNSKFINTIATETWDDLKLENGDLFLFTREDLVKKENDRVKKQKFAKRQTKEKVAKVQKVPKNHWTDEQLALLWDGTIEEVSKKLNKSYGMVYTMRKVYLSENKSFIIPENAKAKRKKKEVKAKEVKPAKEKVIPNHFTEDEMSVLWESDGKAVAALVNKTYQSVYAKRCEYCRSNPEFTIPTIAKFIPPVDCTNPVEYVAPQEPRKRGRPSTHKANVEPAIIAEAKQTIAEKHVEQVVIKKDKKKAKQPVSNTMTEVFKMLTGAGVKPKNITLPDGTKIEF